MVDTETLGDSATVAELLREAGLRLHGSGSPRLDAEVLLASLLEYERTWFYAHPAAILPANVRTDYRMLVEQRRSGYPVAYLTGQREFWSLPLHVNRHTLIPRPETECLVECALADIPAAGADTAVLDLGTGTGAVALAIVRERPGTAVTATDISREALDMARQNAARLGINIAEFVVSDWFSQLGNRRFGVITSNPPYVESGHESFWSGDPRFEPRIARDGGPDGLSAIRRLVPAAIRHLHASGHLLIEHGAAQGAAVRALFAAAGFCDIETHRDPAGLERVTRGRWV